MMDNFSQINNNLSEYEVSFHERKIYDDRLETLEQVVDTIMVYDNIELFSQDSGFGIDNISEMLQETKTHLDKEVSSLMVYEEMNNITGAPKVTKSYLEEIMDLDFITDGNPKTDPKQYFNLLKKSVISSRRNVVDDMLMKTEYLLEKIEDLDK